MNRSMSARTGSALLGALAVLSGCSGDPSYPLPAPGAVVVADKAPPPISGGTMAVTSLRRAVVADSDRDRIWTVDLASRAASEIVLQEGDEPGRVVMGAGETAYVALRRGGAVVTVDAASGKQLARTAVCAAPRGMAFDDVNDWLHVACAGGELVTLQASTGAEVRKLRLGRDLRDVLLRGDDLVVSRFRSAELTVVKADGSVAKGVTPAVFEPFEGAQRSLPGVAWRTIALPDGAIAMVHQRSSEDPVIIQPGGYGMGGCEGSIVAGTVSIFPPSGVSEPLPMALAAGSMPGAILPVDIAVSPNGDELAVVAAGSHQVLLASADLVEVGGGDDCGSSFFTRTLEGEPVAVAYDPGGLVVVQTRLPPSVTVLDFNKVGGSPVLAAIELPGASVADTGHDMFHTNPGGGSALACASCHPEGGDDGRVWHFEPIGDRRTQNLRGGIMQTAPFHWDGDMSDIGAIMDEVFSNRMGGQAQGPRRVRAFGGWLDKIPAMPESAPDDAAAVARGKLLFDDPAVACATCHSGPAFTNNATVDVGTGRAFQVPSLVGVGWRAPFMHDGSALTLADRFTQAGGGGDQHGKTSQLGDAQVADLVSYLETL